MKHILFFLLLLLPSLCSAADGMKIRVLALKHSKEQMAQGDEDLAFRSIQEAQSKGLDIKPIGGHWVDKDGVMRVKIIEIDWNNNIDKFREFVSQEMKNEASYGDTIVVFTIGHGAASGYLDNLGQRADVMKAIAQAAEENNQKTLWWQLSCHATARLPSITTLSERQQELLTHSASSSAEKLSPAGVEGRIMGNMFKAIADGTVDKNGDEQIDASEVKAFLGTQGRASLYFYAKPDQVVFGGRDLANMIPIKDRNNPQGDYPPGYIPIPKKRD